MLSRKICDPENMHLLYAAIGSAAEIQALSEAFDVPVEEIEAGVKNAREGGEVKKRKKGKKKDKPAEPAPEPVAEELKAPVDPTGETVPMVDMASRVTIFVTEPQKVGDGMGAYVSYKVTATTQNQEYKTGGQGVRRRFNDVVWLHENLSFYYPGAILPEVPEKQTMGRFDPVFIEERRRQLERFINRCGSHPELAKSHALRIFLESSDEEWSSAQKSSKVELKADKKAEKKDKAAKQKGLDASKDMISYDPQYDKFVSLREYLLVAQDGFEALKKQLKLNVAHEQAYADLATKLGVAFQDLVPAETLFGALGPALEVVAKALANGISRIHSLAADIDKIQLLDPIREYLGLFDGVEQLLVRRLAALKTYQQASAAVLESSTKLAKAKEELEKKVKSGKAGDKDNQKVQEAQAAHNEKEALCDRRRSEFNVLTNLMFSELRRFHYEKACDFRETLVAYCNARADNAEKAAHVWKQLQEPIKKALPERFFV